MTKEAVNHPSHYGAGQDDSYETIKVIDAWNLDFCLGNAVKYLSRAGKKDNVVQDLKKAIWYINHEIELLEKERISNEQICDNKDPGKDRG
jgi:hypothetical protein